MLEKGAVQEQTQMEQNMVSDEEIRKVKWAQAYLAIDRWLKIICIGIFVINFIRGVLEGAILAGLGLGAIFAGITFIILRLILNFGASPMIKLYLYLTDLFTSKGTRL